MNYMAEYLLGSLTHENRMVLAQYVFIITMVYLAVIIIIAGIGQKTRILTPAKQSKIRLPQWEGNETVIWKAKAGTGAGQPETVGGKMASGYQRAVPAGARMPVRHSEHERRAG
jgi:hypothetical protein